MILESLVAKWSVWKADKAGYKASRAFAEGRAGVPAVVIDSLEKLLDELAHIEPHIGLGSHLYLTLRNLSLPVPAPPQFR